MKQFYWVVEDTSLVCKFFNRELKTLALENTTSYVEVMYTTPNIEATYEIPNVKVIDKKYFIVENLQLAEISLEVSTLENNYSIYIECSNAS